MAKRTDSVLGMDSYVHPTRAELWESTLESLRHAIISGSLPAGTRLVETELSNSLQVSRLPVRQAISRLEQEGLVARTPGRGAYVVEVTVEDVREICDLRRLLECYAARRAAMRFGPEEEERLCRANEEFRRHTDAGDALGSAETDINFHRTIVAIAGSDRLLHMWELLLAPLRVMFAVINPRLSLDALRTGPPAHEKTIEALRSGDPDLAEAEIQRQIYIREGGLIRYYTNNRAGTPPPAE